jgi:hypothetical protein
MGLDCATALHAVARVTAPRVETEEKQPASVRNTNGVTLRESKQSLTGDGA